ncbi:hypothetical protein ACG3RS_01220, partial [Pseudomonas aeruginosa]
MPTAWLDLPAPPALPGLFLRAALRRGIRGKALPERGLRGECGDAEGKCAGQAGPGVAAGHR